MISRASKYGTLAALALALVLAACSSGADADQNTEMETVPVATGRPDTNGSGTQSTEPPTTSDWGDIESEIGVPAGLAGGDNDAIFTMTVNSIEHAETCPSRIDPVDVTPENGAFLVVDITATMVDDYADFLDKGEEPFIATAPDAFYLTDVNNVIQADVITISSYECFSIEEQAAPFINPGETVTGVIALDTNLEHGYLVYNPWGVDGSGWRWQF